MSGFDEVIQRRILACQLGLAAALALVIAAPPSTDLSSSVVGQLVVLAVAVLGALLLERGSRSAG